MKTPRHSRKAFSLIEVIAVIAIAVILIAIAVPVLRNMGSGAGANPGMTARAINGLLQLARSEASAKSTPVWVGFKNRQSGKDMQLIVVTVTTRDGSGDFSSGAVPLGKPETFTGITLDTVTATNSQNVAQLATVEGAEPPFGEIQVAGENVVFDKAIRFGPSGEVTVGDQTPRSIEIGLQPMRGLQKAPGPNVAAIQITGVTGMSKVFQPDAR